MSNLCSGSGRIGRSTSFRVRATLTASRGPISKRSSRRRSIKAGGGPPSRTALSSSYSKQNHRWTPMDTDSVSLPSRCTRSARPRFLVREHPAKETLAPGSCYLCSSVVFLNRDALEFVANLPEELLAPFDVRLGFHALGREAVHDADDAAALGGLGDQHLSLVGGSAVNPADLGHHLDGVEHVDGIKALAEEQDKGVPGADGQGVRSEEHTSELQSLRHL